MEFARDQPLSQPEPPDEELGLVSAMRFPDVDRATPSFVSVREEVSGQEACPRHLSTRSDQTGPSFIPLVHPQGVNPRMATYVRLGADLHAEVEIGGGLGRDVETAVLCEAGASI